MALSSSEVDLIHELNRGLRARHGADQRNLDYYRLKQRFEHLGMAIPPDMRRFMVVANWARVVVRTIAGRQKMRAMILPGQETADPKLLAMQNATNLGGQMKMYRKDKLIFGRAFLSAGTNADNPRQPIVRVESPRSVEAIVDPRTERMTSAGRFQRSDRRAGLPDLVTLMLPESTVWAGKDKRGRWEQLDRDDHGLGVVPMIMGLNERLSDSTDGESELTDIIMLMDAVGRSLTNLQFAQESHGIPGLAATGVTQGDFVDEDGKQLSQFEAYYDIIKMLSNPDARWHQFTAADLKNFDTAMNVYGKQAAVSYGFPARYFGISTSNPPAEGAIRADENDLVNYVEDKNEAEGMELGWLGGLMWRLAYGKWVKGNQVRVDYHDPGTPTFAQRADALTKMRAVGGISREGMWDELGWSPARKAKELEYLRAERAEQDRTLLAIAGGDPEPGVG